MDRETIDRICVGLTTSRGLVYDSDSPHVEIIRLANAALPDSDARKVTQAKVDALRDYLAEWEEELKLAAEVGQNPNTGRGEAHRLVLELAAALEWYVDPRG
jgi:DNA-binding IclR family transcriptional regulator